MSSLYRLFFHHPLPGASLLAAMALGGALLSQYGFGYHPCDLCLLQRYPYVAILLTGIAGVGLSRRWPRLRTPFVLLMIALFLLDAGIAGYHVGVEQGWVEGPSACSGTATGTTLDDLRTQIMNAPLVSCKDTTFSLLGLSMAAWNLVYALACASFFSYVFLYDPRRRIHGFAR